MSFTKDTPLSQLTIGQFEQLITAIAQKSSKKSSSTTYLNTIEAAAFIRKSPEALRQIVYNDKIKSIKRGNNLLFLESDLIDWLESGRKSTFETLSKSAEDLLKPEKKTKLAPSKTERKANK